MSVEAGEAILAVRKINSQIAYEVKSPPDQSTRGPRVGVAHIRFNGVWPLRQKVSPFDTCCRVRPQVDVENYTLSLRPKRRLPRWLMISPTKMSSNRGQRVWVGLGRPGRGEARSNARPTE